MLKLYDYMQCPFGQKARIVLAEKQLDYELVPVDLRKNEQFETSFVAMSPFHKVPVLVDQDGDDDPERIVVYDSTTIGEYLEDEYPEPALLPPAEQAAEELAGVDRAMFGPFGPNVINVVFVPVTV